ncbi:MAG: biotin--[acetyl-CoA-carboxylase] ligase [Pseudomonadota bacterium]
MFPPPAQIEIPGLKTKTLGHPILHVEETESTQNLLRELFKNGAREGTLVLADRQTRGRGRLGRSWSTIPGLQILASVLLVPNVPPAHLPFLSLAAGLAVAEALEFLGVPGTGLKWPNDVMVGGRKICGLLAEVVFQPGPAAVLLGMGLNVEGTAEELPVELRETAVTVQMCMPSPCDHVRILSLVLEALEARLDHFQRGDTERLRLDYEKRWIQRGRTVNVDTGSDRITGTAEGIGADGSLLVRDSAGMERRISAGDVSV